MLPNDDTNEPQSWSERVQDRRQRTTPGWGFIAIVLIAGVIGGFGIAVLLFVPSGGLLSLNRPVYDEKLVTSLYDRISPSVVQISIQRTSSASSNSFGFVPTDSGSGFLIDNEGRILTNNHVVASGGEIRITLSDGRVLEATRLGNSPADDLAVLQVDPEEVRGISPLTLADSDAVKAGQLVVSIGSPLQLQNFLSVGVVSGIGEVRELMSTHRPIPNMVWTNARLLPGNSGGPLVNADGNVIGIATAVQVGAGGELGLGFAVPSNIVLSLLSDLIVSQEIQRPWLGISGVTLERDLSDDLNLATNTGVYVTQVWPDSPAEEIGLRDDPFIPGRRLPSGRGDIITSIDGRAIASITEMVEYFNTLQPGSEVVLTIVRGGADPFQIKVTLGPWSVGS
ncbi:MAG: trypsin-like peptidase domain-containing protein [Chloroflexi bacterium]|nr:trypsin-like peptidase domain-containing protein [Chloroflexota bacterium]